MSQLAVLLKQYLEGSPYETVNELTQAAQEHTPMSRAYVSHILQGRRENPAYDKLMAIARALHLDQADTNQLLEAAGLPTAPPPDPRIRRGVDALYRLAQSPDISTEAITMIVDGLVLMVEGLAAGAGVALAPDRAATALRLSKKRAAALPPEESLIDDLLGEILSTGEAHPLDDLFRSLAESAASDRWEVKRRIAESLPRLVQLQPEATLQLAETLRLDYHHDYQTDIRRRVVEAVPALCRHRSDEALGLLAYRERDEIYVAMAAVEALYDLEEAGLITRPEADRHFRGLRVEERPAEEQAVINFLHRLLREAQTDPDKALETMQEARAHPELLFRICIQRTAPRLFDRRPAEALSLMAYFLRRGEDDQPLEHKNLRRPVSKALPEILALLPEADAALEEKIGRLVEALARDPDIHVRRALSDALDRLAAINAEMGLTGLEWLIQDEDPYIRQRAWRVTLHLIDLYPDQATDYYARLLI